MYNYYSNVQKRKVFISYYHGDQEAVNKFVRDFGDVFIPKTVGVKDGDFDFDSNDPQYIMRKNTRTEIRRFNCYNCIGWKLYAQSKIC